MHKSEPIHRFIVTRITGGPPHSSRYAPGMSEGFAGFCHDEVEGVPVLWRPDRRFKTFRFMLNARLPLDERAAARSILPSLLLQGTERDADRPALVRRMESLYGAAVMPSSGKMGESHLLRFTLDSIAGAHAPDAPDLMGDGLAMLADILARPRLVNGGFPADVFAREQTQSAHAARAVFNDKMAYAAQESMSHACAGEPMAIPAHGGVEAIEAMRPEDPEIARRDFLGRGELWALAMGALPENGGLDRVARFLSELPSRKSDVVGDPVEPVERPRRADVDRADVQQSKLVLVFRLPWTTDSHTWVARLLFVSMLGGGPHSRLFRGVREELSLAYYAQAVLDRYKGLLVVHVGLDESASERVEQEVLREIGELRAGRFDQAELDTARAGLLSSLAAIDDSIGDCLEFTSRQWVLGQDRTPPQQAELYQAAEPAAIAASMDGLWLDHCYLLAPNGERSET